MVKGQSKKYVFEDSCYLIQKSGNIYKEFISDENYIPDPIKRRIDRAGYFTVRLSEGGFVKTFYLHRLLANSYWKSRPMR